jgi:ubiquitin-activating enzyme E1
MAAQDTMKVCTGKFTPVHQYFTFDAIDCWPPTDPTEKNNKATGSRYDRQEKFFGWEILNKFA